MKESIYLPIIDNGMGYSRSSWGLSMFMIGHSDCMAGRKVIVEGISYPYPDGAMQIATNSFLESECDRMLIIDTDIRCSKEDVANLLSHDLPFIAGIYPKKKPGLEFPVCDLENGNCLADDGRPYPREVARCARGFTAIRREVFELMQPHVEQYDCPETGRREHLYWKTLPGGHSEDFAFCDLYRKLGGKIFVDPRIAVIHEGSCSYPIPGTY